MFLPNRLIPFDSIDFSGEWNLHPWELYTLTKGLASSFLRTGILHPPIVLAKKDSRFAIVCGFKRLLFAASTLQSPEISCLILPGDTAPQAILEIILADQLLTGSLSLAEKARFLVISSSFLGQEEIMEIFFDRLMLSKRPSTFSSLAEILEQHPLLISGTHCGDLQDKIVLELLRLPSAPDRLALVNLFKRLCMGDGKQRKILPLIRDLAFRHDMAISAYLEKISIQEILDHPGMNNPQKTQRLISFLQQQTNPLSTSAESEFAHKVKSMDLPQMCAMSHSPAFEKDEVSLTITFKDFAACQEWLPTLKKSLN